MKEKFRKKYFKIFVISFSILFLIVGIVMIFFLKNINPEKTDLFPPCIIYKLTGLKCAGCGMTRAVHQILNLNYKEAFLLNPLIFIYAIILIYILAKVFILKLINYLKNKDNANNEELINKKLNNKLKKEVKIILYIVLFITVLFMLVRNIIAI